jgi:KaiC/GvpD/RAD55 family RecA-like ATPase
MSHNGDSDVSGKKTEEKQDERIAHAGDRGLEFVLQDGLKRGKAEGHLGAIVGRGGSGKSILALQFVTQLLNDANKKDLPAGKKNTAFYFTLEATPKELCEQVKRFKWGTNFCQISGDQEKDPAGTGELCLNRPQPTETKQAKDAAEAKTEKQLSDGVLCIESIPSPAESLTAVAFKIRQTIATKLRTIGELVAIIIDPIGGIAMQDGLESDLFQVSELATSHQTFVWLLTERYIFEKYHSIEHHAQSIIHLEYDPGNALHHRRLYVQKARGQSFRSGYHSFDLYNRSGATPPGVRVFPSIQAQSAHAHEEIQAAARPIAKGSANDNYLFSGGAARKGGNQEIAQGSAVFLMGPPGTFKDEVVREFVEAGLVEGAALYLSFKTEGKNPFDSHDFEKRLKGLKNTAYFYGARSPLLTPEEILFTIQGAVNLNKDGVKFNRAVIWGLRRLYDFPNFKDTAVQFLEALVTLLSSKGITSLLVDWPDKANAVTVPIVDLCQYTLLTRVCYRKDEGRRLKDPQGHPLLDEGDTTLLDRIWDLEKGKPVQQAALLRVQRARKDVHHDSGFLYRQLASLNDSDGATNVSPEADDAKADADRWVIVQKDQSKKDQPESDSIYVRSFDDLWTRLGRKWEDDLSFQS